jgi:hypothetical protein
VLNPESFNAAPSRRLLQSRKPIELFVVTEISHGFKLEACHGMAVPSRSRVP